MCHICLLTACSQSVIKPVWRIPLLCVQWKTPDAGQRNCPKHVEFYSKNKFEKLVQLVGFIIRIYHDARSPEHLSRCTVTWTFITMHGHLNVKFPCSFVQFLLLLHQQRRIPILTWIPHCDKFVLQFLLYTDWHRCHVSLVKWRRQGPASCFLPAQQLLYFIFIL